ncbi:MAG TPA: hypothetical protein VFZ40_21255 [Pyrinomonadaceae bacterium]
MTQKVRVFYECELGDRLIEDARYPVVIRNYLRAERGLLDRIAPQFNALIEIGCMQARTADWAVSHGKRYLGLDIVSRYIREGRAHIKSIGSTATCRVERKDAQSLVAVLAKHRGFLSGHLPIAFFPFNSIGNVSDVRGVVKALTLSSLPFIIATYGTDEYSTKCRGRYYARCDYHNLRIKQTGKGVHFGSSDGLSTYAYSQKFIESLFPKKGVIRRRFSSIGVAYLHPLISTKLDESRRTSQND